jgi:hypothetical protein
MALILQYRRATPIGMAEGHQRIQRAGLPVGAVELVLRPPGRPLDSAEGAMRLGVLIFGLVVWGLAIAVLARTALWFLLPALPWLWATGPQDTPPTGMGPVVLILGLPAAVALGSLVAWLRGVARAWPVAPPPSSSDRH